MKSQSRCRGRSIAKSKPHYTSLSPCNTDPPATASSLALSLSSAISLLSPALLNHLAKSNLNNNCGKNSLAASSASARACAMIGFCERAEEDFLKAGRRGRAVRKREVEEKEATEMEVSGWAGRRGLVEAEERSSKKVRSLSEKVCA